MRNIKHRNENGGNSFSPKTCNSLENSYKLPQSPREKIPFPRDVEYDCVDDTARYGTHMKKRKSFVEALFASDSFVPQMLDAFKDFEDSVMREHEAIQNECDKTKRDIDNGPRVTIGP